MGQRLWHWGAGLLAATRPACACLALACSSPPSHWLTHWLTPWTNSPPALQVVAGANYLMELQLVCSEGNFLGQTTTRMEATVYQPLPYTNQPPQLSKFVIDVDV